MKRVARQEPLYIHITSLGCAKNLVDTELAAASLLTEGFGFSQDLANADVEFINTCAFIKPAREEASKAIAQAVKWKAKRPSRKIVVGGCVVEWDKTGEFRASFPEVDLWTRIDSAASLGRIVKGLELGSRPGPSAAVPAFLYDHSTPRLQLTPPHYAYLKISEGCDNRCSYCAIPSIRGPLRSRPAASVVEEARNLLRNGCRELIVIAQDSGAFGRDRRSSGETLAGLLRSLDALEGEFWLRVMYVHPASATDELLSVIASGRHIIPCLEMPLQHIADPVLKGMGRRISKAATLELLSKMRKAVPGLGLRTTFLVGFPGETEADFEELLAFVKEQRFERLGVFTYCREEGTPASALPGQVPQRTADARRDALMAAQAQISLERNKALAGSALDVIVDEVSGRGKAKARTFMDAPEIDNLVSLSGASGLKQGDFAKVLISSGAEYELAGRPAATSS